MGRGKDDPFGNQATDYSATGLIKFIEGFFHKHVRLRCDGERASVALANKVKHLAGDLVKFETTPKHSSSSNLANRPVQAVEKNNFGRFVRIARCALAVVKLLARTNRSGHGCCVMRAGKSVDTSKRATG